MTSVLFIMMFVNGEPSGEIQRVISLTQDCKTEIAIVDAVNRNKLVGPNVQYKTVCSQ
jgi:phosphoribosyl-AMP cyclohydrolase